MDFDIDSVTILTVDLNSQGKYELWSPYASLVTRESLNASKKLPLPTNIKLGDEGNPLELVLDGSIDDNVNFFEKYKDLFIFEIKNGKINKIKFKIPKLGRNPEIVIGNINKLLREKTIYKPQEVTEELKERIKEVIKKYITPDKKTKEGETEEIPDFEITDLNVKDIYNEILKAIDNHNLYLKSKYVNKARLRKIINNSNHTNMYNIITDAINLILSMVSVDSVTEPVKELSKTTKKAIEEYLGGAGNYSAFGEMIHTNFNGKDCIAKSASTLKVFFKLSHYYNKILNSSNPELQELLTINEDILNKCGKYKPLLANVQAVDPSTIVDLKLIDLLLDATPEDLAALLSALLGLSAD